MEIEQVASQEIVALRNRKQQILTLAGVFCPVFFILITFTLFTFIPYNKPVRTAFGIIAIIFLLEIIFILWMTR